MTYGHFINHKSRCEQWAFFYSTTGAYRPMDVEALVSFENEKTLSSMSTSGSPTAKRMRLIDVAEKISVSRSKTTTASSGFKIEDNARKIKNSIMSRLRADIEQFYMKIHSQYESSHISSNEIDDELMKICCKEESLLKMGFVKLNNIIRYGKKRSLTERRLIKISCLPDCPSDEEIRIFSNHFNSKPEIVQNMLEKRISNDGWTFRSDKGQVRLSLDTQIEIMKFIYQNAVFSPRKCGILKKKVSQITNLSSRIFLR